MKITISVILCFMISVVYGQNTGAYLTSYSSAPLEVDFDTRQASNFEISRNFGFQLNIPIKINKIPSLICEFNLGLDSYSFDLQPYGIQRSFFIHYRGLSLGYEYRHSLKENNYLRLGGAVSFLNFLGARSSIGVQASDTRISTTALIGTHFRLFSLLN